MKKWKYNNIKRVSLSKNSSRLNKYSTLKNTIYGVDLNVLTYSQRKLLQNRRYTKRISDDDTTLKMLFFVQNLENDHTINNKIYYLEHLNMFVRYNDLNYYLTRLEWKCSFCNNKIILDTNKKTKYTDLVCDDCKQKIELKDKKNNINSYIIINFIHFTRYISNILEKEYKYLFKEMKKNNKK